MATLATQNQQFMSDDARMRQYAEQRKAENYQELQTLDDQHKRELVDLTEKFEKDKKELEKAFQVSLSTEAKQQNEQIETLRKKHEEDLSHLKTNNEKELVAEEKRSHDKTESFRHKQDEVIQRLHARYQAAQDEIRKQNGEIV